MTPAELIVALEQIKKNKLEDLKGRFDYHSNRSFFIVMQDSGEAEWQSSVSFIYSGAFTYALYIIDYGYTQQPWSKNNWELMSIITSNNILSSIPGEVWTLTSITFGFTPYGYMAPSFVLKLNDNHEESVTYETASDRFDLAWKFFLELNREGITHKEAETYKKYYKERLHRNDLELTVERYKEEMIKKESVTAQYKELLKMIEEIAISNRS